MSSGARSSRRFLPLDFVQTASPILVLPQYRFRIAANPRRTRTL
jgi:hypothetical protein